MQPDPCMTATVGQKWKLSISWAYISFIKVGGAASYKEFLDVRHKLLNLKLKDVELEVSVSDYYPNKDKSKTKFKHPISLVADRRKYRAQRMMGPLRVTKHQSENIVLWAVPSSLARGIFGDQQ